MKKESRRQYAHDEQGYSIQKESRKMDMEHKVNIAQIMLPKISTVCICDSDTVRRGMEVFQQYGYTAIPVVSEDGKYLGSVSEGDFWRHMCRIGSTDKQVQEEYLIRDIYRPDFCEPLLIEAEIQELVDTAMKQNFVPIIDGRGCLSGIVTRQRVIQYLAKMVF